MPFTQNNYLGGNSKAADPFESAVPYTSRAFWGLMPLGVMVGRTFGLYNPTELFKASNWVATNTQAGAGNNSWTVTDGAPPTLVLVTDNADGDGVNAQYSKDGGTTVWETFKLQASFNSYFSIRLKMSEVTQKKGEIGFCITDTTLNGGMTDGAYFRFKDGDTKIYTVTEFNSTETETDTGEVLTANTYVWLSFRANADSSVEFFVNGRMVAKHTTNIVNDEELALSLAIHTGQAAALTTTIQHIAAFQESY